MKRQGIFIALVFISYWALAQKSVRYDTATAYIVTKNYDTIHGHLQLTIINNTYTAEDWYKKIYFIDDSGVKKKYEANDLAGYGFNLDSARQFTFRSKEIDIPNKAAMFKVHGTKFVMAELIGYVTLYRYYHEEVGPGVVGWYNERYLQKENGPLILLKRNGMTNKYKLLDTFNWFSAFPEAADYVDKELNAADLTKLIFAFNNWKENERLKPLK